MYFFLCTHVARDLIICNVCCSYTNELTLIQFTSTTEFGTTGWPNCPQVLKLFTMFLFVWFVSCLVEQTICTVCLHLICKLLIIANDDVVSAQVMLKLKQLDRELTESKLLNENSRNTDLNLGLDCMMLDAYNHNRIKTTSGGTTANSERTNCAPGLWMVHRVFLCHSTKYF